MGARILVVDDSPTIRKVVSSILARHDYEPVEAADGLEALQKLGQSGVDLVLVDFVMPRMNGYQLCMTLRQRPELVDMPVVLMSAKGDKIRGKFVQQTGALDAITKPFDARGLIAVVQSALLKKEENRGRRSDAPAPEDDPISSPDSSSLESLSTRTSRASLAVSDHLATLLLPELNRQKPQLSHGDLAHAIGRALTPEATRDLVGILGETELANQTGEVLSGDLAAISIAEILQLLEFQRKTGALALSHNASRVTLFVRDGLLDFATYTGLPEEFLLGRYLVETGALSRERLDECIDGARASGRVLGTYLVEEGTMTSEQLVAALTSQTSELVYEVVRWRTGRFRFLQQNENALATSASLGLRTGGLVMEGFRRVDEWRLIEDSFDFGDVLFRDEAAVKSLEERQALTELELRVLSAIDGQTTARELADGFEGSSFEICKVLYRLLNSRLVKRAG
jgi:CheY-like chemotaxis protein